MSGPPAYGLSFQLDVFFLVPFAAGTFITIAAADLIPEVNRHGNPDLKVNVIHLASFGLGLALLLAAAP